MDFEWDADKAAANLRKHGVDFADVAPVFEDPFAMTIPDPTPGEERFATLGCDALGRIVVVIFTHRGDFIRIISARRANRHETRQYEERR